MSIKFFGILTHQGAARLANAAALGTKLDLSTMAVGDGGGSLPFPEPTQTALKGERRRAALNQLSIDPLNGNQIIAEQVIPENEGGWWIREVGLFDKDGTLIAVANCPESYKPQMQEGNGRTQTIRMILIVNSTEELALKIDPSIVLATRKYVDDGVVEVKAYADTLMATHTHHADPHPQYAPKASPVFTGTPTAPTAKINDNSRQLATTAFVQSMAKALRGQPPSTLNTLEKLATALSEKLAKDQNGADIPDPARFIKNLGLQAQFSGRVLRIKKITQSQTYQWPEDVAAIDVTICGAGGGGGAGASSPAGHGSAGSGGGGGGWARSYYRRGSIPAAVAIDIGTGGQGGIADGKQPTGGGPSLFGDLMTARGGDASGGNLFSSLGGSGTLALFLGLSHESGAGGDSVFSFGAPPLTHDHTIEGFAGVDGDRT